MKFKKKKNILLVILLLLSIISCGTFNKVTTLDPKTGRFPAKKNTSVLVIEKNTYNIDTLKTLVIVPDAVYWIEMTKNMNFFKKVMTFSEFQKDIIGKGLTDKIPSVSDRIGLNNAYKYYGPFVILNITKEQKPGQKWFAGLTLYDPKKAEIFYKNEIYLNLMWDGWTDQGTMYPLFNSLLDYLLDKQ